MSSRSMLQILALACFASLGLAETSTESIITGYGIFNARSSETCMLTQFSGYASSSNTLYTGAQGSEHSATFTDPGDCATNIAVYPIGTLIYVVVSVAGIPMLNLGRLLCGNRTLPRNHFQINLSQLTNCIRDSRNTSPSKTPAATALPNPNRTSTSGWASPATAIKPNSTRAPMVSQSQTQWRPSSLIPIMVTLSIIRRSCPVRAFVIRMLTTAAHNLCWLAAAARRGVVVLEGRRR